MRLVTFFLITFAITWPCFLSQSTPLLYLGIFAPAIVGLSLSSREERLAILRRLFQWNVPARWYVFAVAYMAAVKLTVAVLHRILAGAWPRFGHEAWYIIVAATIGSTIVGGQSGEEIGWRGFALPRLAARFGYAAASLILGVIWALWHLPLFFHPAADTYGQSFVVYTLQVTAVSVAIAWLYERSSGSLLLTMLMHSAINQSKGIVPSALSGATNPFVATGSLVAWLTVAVLWICAAFFLWRLSRSASFSPELNSQQSTVSTSFASIPHARS